MSKSLISDEKRCIVCGDTMVIHKHHIYEGHGRRRKSEQDGCWCYLCGWHHNLSNQGIHYCKGLDLDVKKMCQEKWEEKNGSREDFIKRFGKSYL